MIALFIGEPRRVTPLVALAGIPDLTPGTCCALAEKVGYVSLLQWALLPSHWL
jgi:hypothetical protein